MAQILNDMGYGGKEKLDGEFTEDIFQPGDTLIAEGDWGKHVLRRSFNTPVGSTTTHRMQAEYVITKEGDRVVERKIPGREKDLGVATLQEVAALSNKRLADQEIKKAA